MSNSWTVAACSVKFRAHFGKICACEVFEAEIVDLGPS